MEWWANKYVKNEDSYYQECQRLLQFLRRLPEGKSRELPIAMPKMPTEFSQPTFSEQEIEKLIWACVLDNIKPNIVIRLAVATIYGARLGELTELSFSLNGDKSSVFIKSEKGGQRKPQPLPNPWRPFLMSPLPKRTETCYSTN